MPVLRQGDRGIDVLFIQKSLNLLGENLELKTQVYGPTTTAAVKRFQQRAKLKVDGLVGPKTFEAITTRIYEAGLPLDENAIATFQSRDSRVTPVPTIRVKEVSTGEKIISFMNQEVFPGLRVAHIIGLGIAAIGMYSLISKKSKGE